MNAICWRFGIAPKSPESGVKSPRDFFNESANELGTKSSSRLHRRFLWYAFDKLSVIQKKVIICSPTQGYKLGNQGLFRNYCLLKMQCHHRWWWLHAEDFHPSHHVVVFFPVATSTIKTSQHLGSVMLIPRILHGGDITFNGFVT